jgi:ribonuclease P protein component
VTGVESTQDFRFRKSDRLLSSSEFTAVFNTAVFKASHPAFLLLAIPNNVGHARLGLVIAKKHVRLAVARAKIKRLVRESFRLKQHHLPTIDAIVLARRGSDQIPNAEVFECMDQLWKRVAKKARDLS